MTIQVTSDSWHQYPDVRNCPAALALKDHFSTPNVVFGDTIAAIWRDGEVFKYNVTGFAKYEPSTIELELFERKPCTFDKWTSALKHNLPNYED